ncbi:MAG: MaoC family dehydratase N-terminal domain-containing protein [Betaproteobacteria bacterium]|nr:MaoC family dehydratase N-terminal domain-containing protein [Betaproteobacteria bacterium]
MIDRRHIGMALRPAVLAIERGRLRFFAQAIGETDPVYLDETAARAAGYPDLPAPPTFLFAAELDAGSIVAMLDELGIPLDRILHGEQGFTYRAPVCAGDTVTVTARISDIYARKGGALEFIVKDATVTNQHGTEVAAMRSVIVVRN